MRSKMSMTNVSFEFLKNSSEFNNLLLNNISSCVLLVDKEIRLKAYNDALKTIFSNRKDEDLLYVRCGEAIGCAYQIEEEKECGKTSQCNGCELKLAILESYMNNKEVYKRHVTKPFFTHDLKKIDKHLQFSTRLFVYEREKYVLMIIDDITDLVEAGGVPISKN